jgi:polyphosphate kinase 2 (PPK2 family)
VTSIQLWLSDRYVLLLVFHGINAAGKDGAIRHVMSGVNPQGCDVFSFKQPTAEELEHDFLWRTTYRLLPQNNQRKQRLRILIPTSTNPLIADR